MLVTENTSGQDKLHVKWFGPHLILRGESAMIYEVEDLITKQVEMVHFARLKKFVEKELGLTESISREAKQNLETHYETI